MKRMPIHLGSYIVHLRAFSSGKKIPVVLIHGLGVSGTYFMPFAQILARSYNVYIIDLPGYGETPKPPAPLTIPQLADLVIDFIHVKELAQVIVIGQSMGCQIIAHAAVKQPSLFKKMILLAPTVNKKERSIFIQSLRLLQDTLHEPARVNWIVLCDYLRMGIARYLTTSRYMVNDHIEKTLLDCLVPTYIIRGTQDKIVPSGWLELLSHLPAVVGSAEIPDAPHLLHYKKPQELMAACQAFIEN